MEQGLTKQRIVAELVRSVHGKLDEYLPIAQQGAKEDPEFMAHLIAWNEQKGQIRDSKIALPVAVMVPSYGYVENSLAHMALLDPRSLVKALDFARGRISQRALAQRLVEPYLRARESKFGWWEKTAMQHRQSLKTLYAKNHIKPSPFADRILFNGEKPKGTVFADIANLKDMPPLEAAGVIMERRLPFLVVVSALGKKAKDTELVLALIERMSATELVTNTKMLERLGVKEVPALRAAYEAGLQKVIASKAATLKTTRAAQAQTDEKLKAKLVSAQEKQLQNISIEGDWLVLGDKSGSMQNAIEVARVVAATLAKVVKGKVHLIFFDNMPRHLDVTGQTYEQILALTRGVNAVGGTSIGCGVQWALDKGLDISGIAIVSDGGENVTPYFPETYQKMVQRLDHDIPVYFYRVGYGDNLTQRMTHAGLDMQVFPVTDADYYSLPNLVQTMRANRYSLTDEIMASKLLTLDEVFKDAGIAA